MWVLGLVVAVDAMDQSIVRGVQTLIQKDFGLSDFDGSVDVGVRPRARGRRRYRPVISPTGCNRKRVIAMTVCMWSGITALTGLRELRADARSCAARSVSASA